MKLSRREKVVEPDEEAVDTADDDALNDALDDAATTKGRPTPKRRDAQGRRGPVTAPKTRKEAYARQKQLGSDQKSSRARTGGAAVKPRSAAEQRAALRRGDPDALPRRDQGKTRKLARDYVDSHRMFSNYLLVLFPLMIIAAFVPRLRYVQLLVIVLFVLLIVEWYFTGRRIRAMSMQRFNEAQGGNLSIGFYAGSRAYLPRRWRLPGPQVERGDDI